MKEHDISYVMDKTEDYKICSSCGRLNWYENDCCVGCGNLGFHKLDKEDIRQLEKDIKRYNLKVLFV